MPSRTTTAKDGGVDQKGGTFSDNSAFDSAVLQGAFNLTHSNIKIKMGAPFGKTDGGKRERSSDPLCGLTVLNTSMASLQNLFDQYPEVQSTDQSANTKPQNEKERRNEDRNELMVGLVLEKCARFQRDMDEASRTLAKLRKDSSSGFAKLTGSAWSNRKLDPLKEQLSQISGELKHYLKRSLGDPSSETKQYLDQMSRKAVDVGSDGLTRRRNTLREWQDELLDDLADEGGAVLSEVLNALKQLHDECRQLETECSIIQSLTFPGIKERESTIGKEYANTMAWVFEDEHAECELHLHEWLKSGEYVFWVTGHAGSGKSTFMKYVANHDTTKKALETWADGKQLVIANYYFWIAGGAALQTTKEGLLRSLLYAIFCFDTSLIEKVSVERKAKCPGNLNGTSWSSRDLDDTIARVLQDPAQDKKYCFFVDGLDEYQGVRADSQTEENQDRDIARCLSEIASRSNVKICASSRFRRTFEERFGAKENSPNTLLMQEHTYEDIESYTKSLLEEDKSFQRRKERDPKFNDLVEQVAKKAEGVWIWVKRAVAQVSESVEQGWTPEEISDKISNLPDLDGLYDRDLMSIEKDCKEQAAQIFLMCLHANESIPILTFYLAGYMSNHSSTALFDDDSLSNKTQLEAMLSKPSRSEERRIKELGEWKAEQIEKVIRDHQDALEARCQGFMKVIRSTGADGNAVAIRDRLVFAHRTGRDFLDRQYSTLRQLAQTRFKINEALLKAFSLHVQCTPRHINTKRRSFIVLLSNILYCAAQHQVGKGEAQADTMELIPDVASDELQGTDFSKLRISSREMEHAELEDADADAGTDASDASSTVGSTSAASSTKSKGFMERMMDKFDDWMEEQEKSSIDMEANIVLKVIQNPKYSNNLISETPPAKRKRIQDAAVKADPTTCLWTALHVLPTLVWLQIGKDMNKQRGRSSVWGCWLQILLNVKRNGAMTDILPTMRKLTILLIDWGANEEYPLRNTNNGKEYTARDIIEMVFGQADGQKLIATGLKKRRGASMTLPSFCASLLALSIADPIFMMPGFATN